MGDDRGAHWTPDYIHNPNTLDGEESILMPAYIWAEERKEMSWCNEGGVKNEGGRKVSVLLMASILLSLFEGSNGFRTTPPLSSLSSIHFFLFLSSLFSPIPKAVPGMEEGKLMLL